MLALGLVETRGLLAAIEGADAMLKAADVRLLEKNLATGGLVTITIAGEVSAVQASVDAAKACIQRIAGSELISAHVIPRPDQELNSILLLDPDPNDPRDAEYFLPEKENTTAQSGAAEDSAPASSPLSDAVSETVSIEILETPGESEELVVTEFSATLSETDVTATEAENQASVPPDVAHPDAARLKNMSLNRLRQLARTTDGLSMTEEAIASADKKSLIAAITRAFRKIEE